MPATVSGSGSGPAITTRTISGRTIAPLTKGGVPYGRSGGAGRTPRGGGGHARRPVEAPIIERRTGATGRGTAICPTSTAGRARAATVSGAAITLPNRTGSRRGAPSSRAPSTIALGRGTRRKNGDERPDFTTGDAVYGACTAASATRVARPWPVTGTESVVGQNYPVYLGVPQVARHSNDTKRRVHIKAARRGRRRRPRRPRLRRRSPISPGRPKRSPGRPSPRRRRPLIARRGPTGGLGTRGRGNGSEGRRRVSMEAEGGPKDGRTSTLGP